MSKNTNIGQTVEAWADIVIKEWLNKIKLFNIEGTGNLVNSFFHHINTQADGDPVYIDFAFEYYGKMVNLGVGKGVSLFERETMVSSGFTSRKPKPWYDKVFLKQLKILRHLLAEKYALKSALIIRNNLEENN